MITVDICEEAGVHELDTEISAAVGSKKHFKTLGKGYESVQLNKWVADAKMCWW